MVIIAIGLGWLLVSIGFALLIAPLIGGARRLGDRVEQRLRRRGAYGDQSPAPAHSATGERSRALSPRLVTDEASQHITLVR